MNIIVRLRQRLNKKKGAFEVWDTSAISIWFDTFQTKVLEHKTTIVLHEGVVHELSNGRHRHEVCRNAYNFILKLDGDKILRVSANDATRSWSVDEQLVDTVYQYHQKGYNICLVTCDKDQAYKAEIKGLKTQLLYGNNVSQDSRKLYNAKREYNNTKQNMYNPSIKIPCIVKGNITYIDVKHRAIVYDYKGRKIARNRLVQVEIGDRVEYMNNSYYVSSISGNYITLKRR